MTADLLNVLVLEDEEIDALFLDRLLKKAWPGAVEFTRVVTMEALEAKLAETAPDVVFADLTVPDATGLEIVDRVHRVAPSIPLVVLTGNSDPANAVDALQRGAQDYLIKGEFHCDALSRSLRYSLARAQSDSELRETMAALTQSNSELNEYAGIVAMTSVPRFVPPDFSPIDFSHRVRTHRSSPSISAKGSTVAY